MSIEPVGDSVDSFDESADRGIGRGIGLVDLASTFFRIGATTFGGLWGATKKLEDTLVNSKGWLTIEDQQTLMVAATLIPAPKFLAFGGLVGFRLRGWPGSLVALVSLIAPASIFVLLGVILLTPELVGAPLIPVRRAVGIGVVGLLFGNAYHQIKNAKVTGRNRKIGIGLAIAVAAAAIAGIPLLVASIAGFAIGVFFIRAEKRGTQ